jgi:Cu(I)/Ag(I) efflux system membrane fusion protein
MKKKLLLILLPLIIWAKEVTVEQLFNVQTIKVKSVSYTQSDQYFGYTQADENNIVNVVPRFSGYIDKLYIKANYEKVKKNQALMRVYSPEILQAKEEYLNAYEYNKKRTNKAMLAGAKEKLILLGVKQKELRQLLKRGKTLFFTTIYAPISGVIYKKNIYHGDAFKAKEKLFTIINLKNLWVNMKFDQSKLNILNKYTNFYIDGLGIDGKIKAQKDRLIPEIKKDQTLLNLRLRFKNKNLFPGMYVRILASSLKEKLLILPNTAIIRKNGLYYVFKTGEYEGEYEPSEVKVERLNSKEYKIISGLIEGEEVVNNALFMQDSDAQINGLY